MDETTNGISRLLRAWGRGNWSYASLSPDNETIYFVRREADSDIWVMTLK